MPKINTLPVDDKIRRATGPLANSMDEEINLIKVDPPADGNQGMDIADEFLESVHLYNVERKLFRKENMSPLCGMEIWYENNEIDFVFNLPNEEMEIEYRQQLSGYYQECEIEKITPKEGMFIKTGKQDYESISVLNFKLAKHYFNPIASPYSSRDELDSDPYKRLFNEIDSKDDTRVLIQMLYQPAPNDWTDQQYTNIKQYADRIQNKGSVKTRFFGLKVDEVDTAGIYDETSSDMRQRISEPAYYVNFRVVVINGSNESQEQADRKAESRARTITNDIIHLFQTDSGQKLIPKEYSINKERRIKQDLVNIVERNPEYMYIPDRLHHYIIHNIKSSTNHMILTAGELSGLLHLPSPDAVSTSAISWASKPVDAKAPPDADDFEMTPEEEQSGIDDEDKEIEEQIKQEAKEAEEEEAEGGMDVEKDDLKSSLFD